MLLLYEKIFSLEVQPVVRSRAKVIKKVVVCFSLWMSSHCVKDEIHTFGHDFSAVQYIKKYLANSA